ncbi:MAG TPA: CCA tRNA nucleotidyltransferase [Terriglobales bacterium]|nr:CCA tRNA nucleotidyltransferase [Terriglobales bacterium]
MLRESATSIVSTLRQAGHRAYLVGGCVRDLVLGREPADYDVATDATPDQVMRIFPRSYAVGAQFGVVLIPLEAVDPSQISAELQPAGRDVARNVSGAPPGDEAASRQAQGEVTSYVSTEQQERGHAFTPEPGKSAVIEVATFRSDIGYSDGRHPDQVRYTSSPQEDVQRRDFTINGLLYDPVEDRVLDYVGGLADIRRGVVQTIGDPEQRFGEDKLRMLRAVRFAARFGYSIEPGTFSAIQRLAPQIGQVSCERIREELTKMLTEGHARRAFELLDESGLLRQVLPEISAMKGVEQPPQFHPEGDVWVHTLLLLEQLPHPCPKTLAWGALLHDVGKPPTFRVAPDRIRFDEHVSVGVRMAEEICRRLRFSNDDTEPIAALVANHMRFADALKMKESTLKRFLRLPRFPEHLELHRMDCLSSHGDLTLYNFVKQRFESTPSDQVRPRPLLTGNDLIRAGYKPGPEFKEILAAVEDAQLEGRVESREQAMKLVREQFPAEASG